MSAGASAGPARFECFALSRPGRGGNRNDDFVAIDAELGAFVVADGLGGRAGGDRASRAATTAFLGELRGLDRSARPAAATLRRAVAAADRAVRAVGAADERLAGLGTTLSAVVLDGPSGRIAHVGDSRVYRFRAGRLDRLTADHSLAGELVALGRLSPEQARRYPLRHMLVRALGAQGVVEPDLVELALAPDDWLILATDGLTGALDDACLAGLVAEHRSDDAERLCRALMDAVLGQVPRDDATVAVVRLADDGRADRDRLRGVDPVGGVDR